MSAERIESPAFWFPWLQLIIVLGRARNRCAIHELEKRGLRAAGRPEAYSTLANTVFWDVYAPACHHLCGLS